jgi:hypothetical protein
MNNDMFLSKLVNMNYDEFFVSSSISKFRNVKEYMERNMPEVWEDYLSLVFELPLSQKDTLNYILDLNNLVTYLSEYQEEWGFKECADWMNEEISPACCDNCEYEKKGLTVHMASYGCFIKHPALVYLEQEATDEG